MMNSPTGGPFKRYVPAPNTFGRQTAAVNGVWVDDNEEVEWHMQYNPDGSQTVTGYSITKKPSNAIHN